MSKTEIESEFRTMTQAERLQMAELLDFIIHENDAEYQATITRRIARSQRGEGVTSAELEAVHQRLIAKGR